MRFYSEIDTDIYYNVQHYIICLQEQEAIEKAQEQQALLEAQQKAKKESNKVKQKTQKQKFIYSKGRIEVSMANSRCNQHRQKLNSKNNSPSASGRLNSQISIQKVLNSRGSPKLGGG